MAQNPYGSAPRDRASANGDAHLVSGTKLRYRKDFTDPTLAAWDVVTGSGMAVTATNSTLQVTTGTSINSTTSVTSKETFTAPFRASFGVKLSQKIINQDFFVELVAVDKENPKVLDETAVAAWRISGTDSVTTTVARAEVRNGQTARVQSGNLTTAAQTADSIFEIVLESDEVSFHNKPIDSTAGKTVSFVRNSVAPDPNRDYKLRYRIVNGGTAPASTTTFTSQYVTAVDYTEIQAELTGAQGRTDAAGALAVHVANTPNVGGEVRLGANAATGGTAIAKILTAATTNATLVKSTAGRLYGYVLTNTTAATKFVRLYNLTTAPTVGTSVPVMVVAVPPNNTVVAEMTIPVAFATGISYAVTGAFADLDATVVAAGDVVGALLYA